MRHIVKMQILLPPYLCFCGTKFRCYVYYENQVFSCSGVEMDALRIWTCRETVMVQNIMKLINEINLLPGDLPVSAISASPCITDS